MESGHRQKGVAGARRGHPAEGGAEGAFAAAALRRRHRWAKNAELTLESLRSRNHREEGHPAVGQDGGPAAQTGASGETAPWPASGASASMKAGLERGLVVQPRVSAV